MKKILSILFLFTACTREQIDLSEKSKKEIITVDLAMSDLAAKEGFHSALLAYADDSVVKPSEGEFPVIGKEALTIYWSGKEVLTNITLNRIKLKLQDQGR